jgi:hypothetical protein
MMRILLLTELSPLFPGCDTIKIEIRYIGFLKSSSDGANFVLGLPQLLFTRVIDMSLPYRIEY